MRLLRWLFVMLLVAVTLLSLLPLDQPDFSPNDKVNHLLGWGALGVLVGLGWPGRWLVWPLLWGYSWLLEVAQGLTAYRLFSVADGVANLAGLVLAVVLLWWCDKMRLIRHSRLGAGRPE